MVFVYSHLAERSGQNILERRRMKQIHDLLLAQALLQHQTEEHRVAELTEVVEQVGPGVRVLDNVLEGGLVIAQHARGAVVVPGRTISVGDYVISVLITWAACIAWAWPP